MEAGQIVDREKIEDLSEIVTDSEVEFFNFRSWQS